MIFKETSRKDDLREVLPQLPIHADIQLAKVSPARSQPHPRSVLFLRVRGQRLGNAPRLTAVFFCTTAAAGFLRIPTGQNNNTFKCELICPRMLQIEHSRTFRYLQLVHSDGISFEKYQLIVTLIK
jgi:hypothetical protein